MSDLKANDGPSLAHGFHCTHDPCRCRPALRAQFDYWRYRLRLLIIGGRR
jgi:hypothetical protein